MLLSDIFHLQQKPYFDKNLKLLHFLRQFVSGLSLLVFLFVAEIKKGRVNELQYEAML